MKLYEFLEEHRDEVLQQCLSRLKADFPAQSQTDEERLDHIPAFLDELAGTLRRAAGDGAAETAAEVDGRRRLELASAMRHAMHRKGQGFNITRVVHDYGIVCNCTNELAAKAGYVFGSREHQIMNVTLDVAIAVGIETYVTETTAIEQQERVDILGTLAHEVRNAANSANLAFALISKGQVGVSGKTADVLRRALARIENLVQTALVEAQLRRKVPLKPERIRLLEVFQQLVDGAFPERGIRIKHEVDPKLEVEADRSLLVSGIGNLIQNALKFTRDNESIVVRANRQDDQVRIEVEDRCGGLPEGASEDLFKPFVQRSLDRSGAGLGLHIARRAVEAHKGTVTVRDLPGVGCVFAISLPAARS